MDQLRLGTTSEQTGSQLTILVRHPTVKSTPFVVVLGLEAFFEKVEDCNGGQRDGQNKSRGDSLLSVLVKSKTLSPAAFQTSSSSQRIFHLPHSSGS